MIHRAFGNHLPKPSLVADAVFHFPSKLLLNPHAQFYGIDINPTHISWAKRFAAEAQLDNVHYLEIGFADLFESGIPDFEFIGMYGVWSWVRQSNRDLDLRRLRAHRLNGQLMGGSMKGQDVGFLLSPVSGGGHRVMSTSSLPWRRSIRGILSRLRGKFSSRWGDA